MAGPPSPKEPPEPVPATVTMVPVAFVTSRTRLLLESAMKTSPAASSATPLGVFRVADVAGPQSPLEPALWAFTDRFHTPFSSTSVTRYGKVWGYQYESIRYFIDCVADGLVPEANGSDGLMVTAMIEATLKSLSQGRPIRIAEVMA